MGSQTSYIFKITNQNDPGDSRLIELLDVQTLRDLHSAIQMAFGAESDSPFSFFLSGGSEPEFRTLTIR